VRHQDLTETQVRNELAKEDLQNSALPVLPSLSMTASSFIVFGLDLEEKQCVVSFM